jgi:hypothetical protein
VRDHLQGYMKSNYLDISANFNARGISHISLIPVDFATRTPPALPSSIWHYNFLQPTGALLWQRGPLCWRRRSRNLTG